MTKQITGTDAYYMGRNDFWNGFKPEPARAGELAEDYKRGYRQARAEDNLSEDTEWD